LAGKKGATHAGPRRFELLPINRACEPTGHHRPSTVGSGVAIAIRSKSDFFQTKFGISGPQRPQRKARASDPLARCKQGLSNSSGRCGTSKPNFDCSNVVSAAAGSIFPMAVKFFRA
jgi:hypothetical protein